MKVTYSLQEFYQEVQKLAALVGETYVVARVECNKKDGVVFDCYISGYKYTSSYPTMQEALDDMRKQVQPPAKPEPGSVDLEIEGEVPEPKQED